MSEASDADEADRTSQRGLRARREVVAKRRGLYGRVAGVVLIIGLFLTLLALGFLVAGATGDATLFWSGAACGAYGLVLFVTAGIVFAQARELESELARLDFELDLLRFKVSEAESRAEKFLWMQQMQLRSYYELNLRQNARAFGLGIVCILLGLIAMAGTISLVIKAAGTLEERLVVGVIGGLGTFLVNYVAAIYLKMHSTTTADLGQFHQRLVSTHQVVFGNLLASRIEDMGKRQETLAALAIKLVEKS